MIESEGRDNLFSDQTLRKAELALAVLISRRIRSITMRILSGEVEEPYTTSSSVPTAGKA